MIKFTSNPKSDLSTVQRKEIEDKPNLLILLTRTHAQLLELIHYTLISNSKKSLDIHRNIHEDIKNSQPLARSHQPLQINLISSSSNHNPNTKDRIQQTQSIALHGNRSNSAREHDRVRQLGVAY